jgi:hypothetical protein
MSRFLSASGCLTRLRGLKSTLPILGLLLSLEARADAPVTLHRGEPVELEVIATPTDTPIQDSDSLSGLRKPSAAEVRALQPGGSIYELYEPFYTGPPPMATEPGGAFSVEVQGTEISIQLRGQPFQSEGETTAE